MPQVEIDIQTARALEFAARMAGVTPGQVVARLVADASLAAPAARQNAPVPPGDKRVAVHATYEGFLTKALFDPETSRVDITSGPLDGTSHKTPSSAARAIVQHYNPDVSGSRNGWSFFTLSDGSKRPLQSIRR
ncbi:MULTISPECIES: hypothetical protein [unclassified Kitasatospora]|uniref:hypothetical protein n=1 Tax=unclassified Kitasatospora TaxID=2633591 RepID=UPI00382582CE